MLLSPFVTTDLRILQQLLLPLLMYVCEQKVREGSAAEYPKPSHDGLFAGLSCQTAVVGCVGVLVGLLV